MGLSFLKLACGDKQAAEVTDEASPTSTGCKWSTVNTFYCCVFQETALFEVKWTHIWSSCSGLSLLLTCTHIAPARTGLKMGNNTQNTTLLTLLWLILCGSGRRNFWISWWCKLLKHTFDYISCPGCVLTTSRAESYYVTLLFHEFCQGKLVLWGRTGPLQDVWWSEWSAARRRDSSCIMYVCSWVYEGLLRVWHP